MPIMMITMMMMMTDQFATKYQIKKWNNEDNKPCIKGREAVKKELNGLKIKDAWKAIDSKDIPDDNIFIKCF
jgi:rRNA-processing protein FCF1